MARDVSNLLIVVADALRRDRVGVYGSDRNLTPFLDQWHDGDDVALFDQAFSCSTATDPSVTSIHTGEFPLTTVFHHSKYVTSAEKHRAETAVTLPEVLGNAGWRTVATGGPLGRWHYSEFDDYPVPAVSRRRQSRIGRLVERIELAAKRQFDRVVSGEDRDPAMQAVDAIANNSEPTYGFVRLMDTHIPYDPPEELVDELLERYDYPRWPVSEFLDEYGERPYVAEVLADQIGGDWSEYGIGRLMATYDATVRRVDEQMESLVAELRDRGLYESTAIVFTSDHGESLTEHDIFFDHHGLYDPTVRVPLFVRGPNVRAPDRVRGIVQLPDLCPTAAELVGIESPDIAFGNSFAPATTEDGEEWRPREIAVGVEAYAHSRVMGRTNRWKYIEHRPDPTLEEHFGDSLECRQCDVVHGGTRELYDLHADPDEERNVAADHPEIAEEFERRLREEISDPRFESDMEGNVPDGPIEYDHEEELMEQLEDLGYR